MVGFYKSECVEGGCLGFYAKFSLRMAYVIPNVNAFISIYFPTLHINNKSDGAAHTAWES